MAKKIPARGVQVGTRIQGGPGGAYTYGTVIEVDRKAGTTRIAWDGGETTSVDLAHLYKHNGAWMRLDSFRDWRAL